MPAPAKWKMTKLEAREAASIAELEARIKDARARVGRIVSAAARDRKLVMSGRNREKLYKQIGDVYLQLDNGLKDWGKDIVSKGAIDWHDAAIRDIKGQTGEDPGNGVTKFSREYAEDVFKRVSPENGRSLAATVTDNMASEDIKALRTATVDVYRAGALSGMTLQDMQKDIQARWDGIAGDRAAFRFVDGAGRPWENARYLQMLVRTTTARVARDSYFDTLAKNGDDLVIVQNADGEACDICNAWDGVILSITGSSEKYPSYQQALDAGCFHPNCRCMAERVDETIDKAEIKKQAETPTPDFEKREDETPAEYRNRMTDEVARYSGNMREDETESTPPPKQELDITPLPERGRDLSRFRQMPPEPTKTEKMQAELDAQKQKNEASRIELKSAEERVSKLRNDARQMESDIREKENAAVAQSIRDALNDVGEVKSKSGGSVTFKPDIVDHWIKSKTIDDMNGRLHSLPAAVKAVASPDAMGIQRNGKTAFLGYDGKKTVKVIVGKDGSVETWIPSKRPKQREVWLQGIDKKPDRRGAAAD